MTLMHKLEPWDYIVRSKERDLFKESSSNSIPKVKTLDV
jgi:hypothetical protein